MTDPSAPSPRKLRILIDGAYREQKQGTGISTYSRTLAAALRQFGHEIRWLSGADAPRTGEAIVAEAAFADTPAQPGGLRRKLQTLKRMTEASIGGVAHPKAIQSSGLVVADPSAPGPADTWLSPNLYVRAHYRHTLLRRFIEVRPPEPVDVFHLSAPLPVSMRGVKNVVTIHDLIPLRLPYATPDNKTEFLARVRACAANADLIITVSETSKKDIVEILQVDPTKIEVTYQSSDLPIPDETERQRLPRSLARFGLEPGGYALFVGALEPKKNLRRMIEAFLEVDSSMPLVLAGPKAWMWEPEIGDLDTVLGEKARRRIRLIGHVPREDLQRLYMGAHIFLFPSLYEGFGLPPLDAMRFGVPCVVSKTGSLPEICGDAALQADPFERRDIRDRIEQLMSDAGLRAKLSEAGKLQAQRFSFEAYVERLGRAYARLG